MRVRRSDRYRAARPHPLPDATLEYDSNYSQYPDALRVSFADGHTVVYVRQIEQPGPSLMDDAEKMQPWAYRHTRKEGTGYE